MEAYAGEDGGGKRLSGSSTILIPDVELVMLLAQCLEFTTPTARMNHLKSWYCIYIILGAFLKLWNSYKL